MNGIEEVMTQFRTESLMRDAAEHFGVSIENLLSHKRYKRLVEARCVISYILYTFESFTYEEIGKVLNRSHATIYYQVCKATRWVGNPRFNQRGAKAIETISRKLGYYED